jgi:multicomponent Na+:H+ antiporter subunit D
MTKIWAQAFWKPKPDVESGLPDPRASRGAGIRTMLIPTSGLAIAAVVMGLVAGPIFAITQEAAIQLLDRQQYITSVLGAG